jgi:hypothetical protein
MPVDSHYRDIPQELRDLGNWVVWRAERRAGKGGIVRATKVPYSARNGKHAKSNDPATWSSFDDAAASVERGYAGLGFCLTPPYVAVDLDGCRPDGNHDEPWAAQIIGELASYAELSPSGHGVHVIVRGTLPDGARQKDYGGDHVGVGLYDAARGRYLTMTGHRIGGNGIIAERTAELCRIHARLFPPKAKAKPKTEAFASDDDSLIERARAAHDGGKFARLFDGQWKADYASQSEADLALCMKLAFWCDRDAARIDALFRRSGLMRDKWLRDDYRESTIARASEQTSETWKPKRTARRAAPTLHVDACTVPPDIELLNALPLFAGHVKFAWLRRRGSLIQAGFADGREASWATATDLRVFARSQDVLLDSTGYLIPTPPVRDVRATWEPVAQLLRRIADADATDIEPPLKDEFEAIIRSTWVRAGRPQVSGREEFFEILQECQNHKRDHTATMPARCCVWVGGVGEAGEQFCWIYQDALLEWLSTPNAKGRHIPWNDVRTALLLLDFNPHELHRSLKGETVHVRVWKGPLDLLVDDDTVAETEL